MASSHAQESDALAGASALQGAGRHLEAVGGAGPDALSAVLRAVRLRGALFFLVDGTLPYVAAAPSGPLLATAIDPGAQQIVSYHVVSEGACWCTLAGHEPVRLERGDVVLVPHGDPYQLSSAPGLRSPLPEDEVLAFFRLAAARALPFVISEGGGGTERLGLVCGFLACDRFPFNPVLEGLPPVLRVRAGAGDADDRLSQLAGFAVEVARESQPGADCMLLRVAELMFVEVVRRHVTSLAPGAAAHSGWLAGLRDPAVGRAMALLHARPAAPWTLAALAREAGASRSRLAERFSDLVGQPPMLYLARWRMQLAARLLADGGSKVAAVAGAVGYESEAAFSRAFKRLVGASPAAWRAGRSPAGGDGLSCTELANRELPACQDAGAKRASHG
jgi:AraC-like DNA-binding protein